MYSHGKTMLAKTLLKSPSLLREHFPHASDMHSQQLELLCERYSQSMKRLKKQKKEKSNISRKFKEAADDNAGQLKDEIACASKHISHTELELKRITQATNELLSELNTLLNDELPTCFAEPSRQLKNKIHITESIFSEPSWKESLERLGMQTNAHQRAEVINQICTYFGHQAFTLLAWDDETLVGGIVLILVNSPIFGKTLVSTPFFNYGGALSPFRDVHTELVSHSKALALRLNAKNLEIRTTISDLPFSSTTKKVSMIKALPESVEILYQQLGSKVRAQINKAKPHNPEIRFGGLELLPDFYRVFSENMRDLGTPVYDKGWFASLLNAHELNCIVCVGYVSDKPVSAGFLIPFENVLEIPWASTLRSANKMNINMWMYSQILEFAIHREFQYFDFGRSTKDAPTYQFKKQWGAKPVQHHWYYPLNSEHQPDNSPENPKFRLMIWCWQKLPVWFANWLGPKIIKGIPA